MRTRSVWSESTSPKAREIGHIEALLGHLRSSQPGIMYVFNTCLVSLDVHSKLPLLFLKEGCIRLLWHRTNIQQATSGIKMTHTHKEGRNIGRKEYI